MRGYIVRAYKPKKYPDFSLWLALASSRSEALEIALKAMPAAERKAEIGVLVNERLSKETLMRLRLTTGPAAAKLPDSEIDALLQVS